MNSSRPTGSITGNFMREEAGSHFTWEEANCRCGCDMPDNVRLEVIQTAEWAEKVRSALGNRAMHVTSWYRCADYNKRIGGASNSQHLTGRAIDFVMQDKSAMFVQQYVLQSGELTYLIRGMGCYRGFTHIDRRTGLQAMVKWYGPEAT